jgi:hypothetical protein
MLIRPVVTRVVACRAFTRHKPATVTARTLSTAAAEHNLTR